MVTTPCSLPSPLGICDCKLAVRALRPCALRLMLPTVIFL